MARRVRAIALCHLQGSGEVLDQVGAVLQADRDAHHALADAGRGQGVGGELAGVVDAGWDTSVSTEPSEAASLATLVASMKRRPASLPPARSKLSIPGSPSRSLAARAAVAWPGRPGQ